MTKCPKQSKVAIYSRVSTNTRKKVLDRDDYQCCKCGKHRYLEVHHIFPMYMGGNSLEPNLITLCKSCHKDVPDDPIGFFKWASHHLPPSLEQSKNVSMSLLYIVKYNKKLKDLFLSDSEKDNEQLIFEIDSFYKDMWGVYVSNDLSNLNKFIEKWVVNNEEEIGVVE